MYGSAFRKIAMVTMLALAMVPAAHATVLAPGGSATPPQDFATGFIGATVADTGLEPIVGTGGVYTANLRSIVIVDNTTGFLDFLYQVLKTGGQDAISQITVANFQTPFTTDVGVCTACANLLAGVTGFSASTEDERSIGTGDVVRWNYGTGAISGNGMASNILVIKTNASRFAPGDINTIDGGVTSSTAFQPTTVPEPGTLGLVLSGLFAVGFVARRGRVVQK